jgi:hypothetical protein
MVLETTTYGVEIRRSIQLSYWGNYIPLYIFKLEKKVYIISHPEDFQPPASALARLGFFHLSVP